MGHGSGKTLTAAVAFLLALCGVGSPQASAQTILTLGSGFFHPFGIALDRSGNVFVGNPSGASALYEILAASGYVTVKTLATFPVINTPEGVAVDNAGNVFVADSNSNAVSEFLAASGYTTVKTLGGGFSGPFGVAVDSSGNVFVADTNNTRSRRSSPPAVM